MTILESITRSDVTDNQAAKAFLKSLLGNGVANRHLPAPPNASFDPTYRDGFVVVKTAPISHERGMSTSRLRITCYLAPKEGSKRLPHNDCERIAHHIVAWLNDPHTANSLVEVPESNNRRVHVIRSGASGVEQGVEQLHLASAVVANASFTWRAV